jgi:hypothetical protein
VGTANLEFNSDSQFARRSWGQNESRVLEAERALLHGIEEADARSRPRLAHDQCHFLGLIFDLFHTFVVVSSQAKAKIVEQHPDQDPGTRGVTSLGCG